MMLHRAYAETPNRILALEMGGNNPLVVWDPTDIHAAAIVIIQSAYLSAGQRCTCARRLIVKDGAHPPLLDQLTQLIDRLILGAPHDQPPPFCGPVIANPAAAYLPEGSPGPVLKGGP